MSLSAELSDKRLDMSLLKSVSTSEACCVVLTNRDIIHTHQQVTHRAMTYLYMYNGVGTRGAPGDRAALKLGKIIDLYCVI